jgi:hypothetical protein
MTRTYSDWSSGQLRVYHEIVWYREDGAYRIECTAIYIEVNGNMVPASLEEVDRYNQQLKQGQGKFAVFDRGFEIHEPHLFLENYNYAIIDPNQPYLDRTAMVVRITSKYLDRSNFTVWIDQESGLLLKYIEDTLITNPLTMMEVTSLDLEPDFTGVEFYQHDILEEEIDRQAATQLGFEVFEPLYLPQGFYPMPMLKVDLKGILVLRLAYTDGIQKLVISQFQLESKSPMGPDPVPIYNINVHLNWYVGLNRAIFKVQQTHFDIKGHIHEEELGSVIASLEIMK